MTSYSEFADVKELAGAGQMVVSDCPLAVHDVPREKVYEAELVPETGPEKTENQTAFEAARQAEESSYIDPSVMNRSRDFLNRFGGGAFESKRYGRLQDFAALKYTDPTNEETDEESAQDFLKRKMGDHLARPA